MLAKQATAGNHSKRGIDGQFKEVNPRTGLGNEAAWGANGEPDACNDKKRGRAGRHQDEGDGDDGRQGQGDD